MEIKLERSIRVEKYKAILDIGEKQPRTDIIAVLKIASHHDFRLTEQIICDEFIFRNNITMAQRILKRCQDFGVVDENGTLTEDGRAAITDGKIYHPQTGVFYIWVTPDPLIPQKILDLELIDEKINLGAEIRQQKKGYDDSRDRADFSQVRIEDLPDWSEEIISHSNILLFDPTQREVRIESIEDKVEVLNESRQLRAIVTIHLDHSTLELEGLYDNKRGLPEFPPFDHVWAQLLGEIIQNWDWESNTLSKIFDELSERERKTFFTQLSVHNPTIENFESFESMTIRQIQIEPWDDSNAQIWANWLLENNISDYIFSGFFQKLKEEIQDKFPKFRIDFPTREQLREKYERNRNDAEFSDAYWYLNAPLDILPIKSNLRKNIGGG